MWDLIPANSQHKNGCAERLIGITKQQLSRLSHGRALTYSELSALLSEVAQIVNSRPLMKRCNDDIRGGGPITPNHLLLGRATAEVPVVGVDEISSITKRMRYIQELKSDFWKKWMAQVFHNLAPSYRWKTKNRNVQVGDVVLVKDSSILSRKYRLAVVSEVKVGTDKIVRSVRLRYKQANDKNFTEISRGVRSIAVIVPVDWSQDQMEAAVEEDVALLGRAELGGVSRQ